MSFQQWLKEQSDDEEARNNIGNIGLFIAGGMLTKPAHAFSALQAMHMVASAGSFSNFVDEGLHSRRPRHRGGMQSVSERLAERIGENKYFPGNTYVHAQLRQRRRDHQQRAPRPLCHLGGVAELVRLYNLRPRTTPHTAHHAPALIHGTGDRSPCHLPHALLAR